MEISIILSGDAYNPRTKGEIKKLLNGLNFIQLGGGSSFTGFIVEDSTITEVQSRLKDYIGGEGITIEQ